jgi:riboflavin kinase/FMN adenylyltransferase
MLVHNDTTHLPIFNKPIVTTGTFDGVHRGHVQLIETLTRHAQDTGGESVLITFDPHPRQVLNPEEDSLRLLTTREEKIRLLEKLGIDHVVFVAFNKAFAALSAHDYLKNFLVDKFHPAAIALGYNHNFGHHRDGNIELLKKYQDQFGYTVIEISKQIVDDINVSSTRIRLALNEGDLSTANHLLGRPYSFSGTVVTGRQLGRTLGFPTANLDIVDTQKLIPAFGVYAVKAWIGEEMNNGVMNIGNRPTVDGKNRTIEVHLFDFDRDIYNQTITVELWHYLRPEQKFEGLEALKAQINMDKMKAGQLLNLI